MNIQAEMESNKLIKANYHKLIEHRTSQVNQMVFFCILMVVCAFYAQINSLAVYIFLNDKCQPTHISIEMAALFEWIAVIVTYQIWNVPVLMYFWPSVSS